jgi:hypothetical protein
VIAGAAGCGGGVASGISGIGGTAGGCCALGSATLVAEVLGEDATAGGFADHGGAGPALCGVAAALVANGGTPSCDWFGHGSVDPGTGRTGPWLIFTYKNAPTTTKIVIVISGRMDFIVRPP